MEQLAGENNDKKQEEKERINSNSHSTFQSSSEDETVNIEHCEHTYSYTSCVHKCNLKVLRCRHVGLSDLTSISSQANGLEVLIEFQTLKKSVESSGR